MTTIQAKERRLLIPQVQIPALLNGQKTQHRVPIRDSEDYVGVDKLEDCWRFWWDDSEYDSTEVTKRIQATGCIDISSPHKVGDRVWIPETWAQYEDDLVNGDESVLLFKADKSAWWPMERNGCRWFMEADFNPQVRFTPKWKSSTQMPRWACRIVREITDVRVEQEDGGLVWVYEFKVVS